ncbi:MULTISPECIES: hypothetical protein [unclassified Sphingomonas]|uniref:hypothetical protein n=1 Tax=unclassified Sphingomonas TaxID=196159 RepID=UPI002269EAE9|nr:MULTISPECIES: hypothetical protein [unclassified Sphingomonas]
MQTDTTRRALLGGASLASVTMIAPALAMSNTAESIGGRTAFRDVLEAADAARERFNSLPADLETADEAQHEREIEHMLAASRRADAAVPATWEEFARWVEHVTDDGHSCMSELNADRMLAHTRRLVSKEA